MRRGPGCRARRGRRRRGRTPVPRGPGSATIATATSARARVEVGVGIDLCSFRVGSLSARSRIRLARSAAARCRLGRRPAGLRGGGRGGWRGGGVGGGRRRRCRRSGRSRRLFRGRVRLYGRRRGLGGAAARARARLRGWGACRGRGEAAAPLVVRRRRSHGRPGSRDAGRRRGCRGQPNVRLQRRRLGAPDQAWQPDQRKSAADRRRRRAWRRSASGSEVGCASRSTTPGVATVPLPQPRPDTPLRHRSRRARMLRYSRSPP